MMHRSKRTLARVALLCLLVIGFSWPTQYAEAQNARCPCFNEMFIVGACGRFETNKFDTFEEQDDEFAKFDCPDPNFDGWRFLTSDQGSGDYCEVYKAEVRGAIQKIPLSGTELMACFDALEGACEILSPGNCPPSPPPE